MVSEPGTDFAARLKEMGLLSPIDPEAYSRWRPAPRLETVHGRVGGFLGNRKANASLLLHGVKEMLEKIFEIKEKRNTSILVVEHNIRSILDVASRVYVLDKGRVAHDGSPDTVQESDILTKVFLGTVE